MLLPLDGQSGVKDGDTGSKETVESLPKGAGIRINGDNSHGVRVHDERLYGRVLSHGTDRLGIDRLDNLAKLSPGDSLVRLSEKKLMPGRLMITFKGVFSKCLLIHYIYFRMA